MSSPRYSARQGAAPARQTMRRLARLAASERAAGRVAEAEEAERALARQLKAYRERFMDAFDPYHLHPKGH